MSPDFGGRRACTPLAAASRGATMSASDVKRRSDNSELVRLWALGDGTRCVLVSVANGLELQIVRNGTVVRSAPCADVRFVRHSAELWRADYEREYAVPRVAMGICPHCGDTAIVNGRFPDSARWLGCASCGNVWLDETDSHTGRTR
jgi:hypothetical protein